MTSWSLGKQSDRAPLCLELEDLPDELDVALDLECVALVRGLVTCVEVRDASRVTVADGEIGPEVSASSGHTGQHLPATLTGRSQFNACRLGHSSRWHSILPDLHSQMTQSIGPKGPITGCQVVPCK